MAAQLSSKSPELTKMPSLIIIGHVYYHGLGIIKLIFSGKIRNKRLGDLHILLVFDYRQFQKMDSWGLYAVLV
jgi:hypothetical protein